MKLKFSKKLIFSLAIVLILIAVFYLFNDFFYHLIVGGGVIKAMAVVPSAGGGVTVSGEPLTTDIARRESPDLLKNEIDKRITKIRPMSTPIDQISRYADAQKSGSMTVDYYSVDVKPTKADLLAAYTEPDSSASNNTHQKAKLNTSNNDIFDVSETILVKDVKGYEADGTTRSKADLVLYITSKEESGEINVYAINGKKIGSIENCVPSIPKDAVFIRMGRAATELDVQTSQFEALPTKDQNIEGRVLFHN